MTPTAKIGLFMLVGLIILGAFIIKIEDIPVGERGERLLVDASFPSVAGLDRQAAVRIAGVRVGKVEGIRLDGARALCSLSLEPGVTLHIGARAQVANLGMLGDKYIEIYPGDPNAPLLAPGTVLEGGTPPSFDDVLKVATDIGADVKRVTSALSDSLGGEKGAEAISDIVTNIRETTAELKELIAANQANVNATTANFRDFSTTLRDELPRIAEKINALADQLQGVVGENREDLHDSLANIRDLSERLKVSANNLNEITTKIASGEGSVGKLINDETTVDKFNATLDSVESGVDTLKNTIGRFERFRLEMNIRGEALPGVSDSRTSFGFDLWMTPKRFWRLEGVDSPFGPTRTTTEVITTTYPDGSQSSITQTTSKTQDKIGFNAQIGYQLLPSTTLRAGVFESRGGFGVDQAFELAHRPLRLSLEAYDFSRDVDSSPHLRLEGRYFVTQNLFLMAGWDDPLFSERSSVLIGGGVRWVDEDLKYSLGLLSGVRP